MTDEPYRWLEAIANRREYIREQLKSAMPVFAFSRPEGVLLVGVGTGQSKVFEIYDRQALAALGHPVDIEKIRQTALEAAHVEGFTRAPEDVTIRRLLNFSISPVLKTSFEQVFSAPLIVEALFAEVGLTPGQDVLARVSFDGTYRFELGGVAVAHTNVPDESAAVAWLKRQLRPEQTLTEVVRLALAVGRRLADGKPFGPPTEAWASESLQVAERTVEVAWLLRHAGQRACYRPVEAATLA